MYFLLVWTYIMDYMACVGIVKSSACEKIIARSVTTFHVSIKSYKLDINRVINIFKSFDKYLKNQLQRNLSTTTA